MKITSNCFNQLKETVGSLPAETGALLAGPLDGPVTHFYFDKDGARGRSEYSPDTKTLTKVLRSWPDDIRLRGFVHSHPPGIARPSTADVQYAQRILAANETLPDLLIPIVQSAGDDIPFSIHGYSTAIRKGSAKVSRVPVEVVEALHSTNGAPATECKGIFDRVLNAYDLPRLERSLVIVAGVGGAASFVENLARAGVGSFALIDPDTVSITNLATQAYFLDDVGVPKVSALARRIMAINPAAKVMSYKKCLEEVTAHELDELQFSSSCSTILLVAMTDSFMAQATANKIALARSLPLLAGQVYHEGHGAEVVFTVPGVTPACARCVLSARYKAYANGYANEVTSRGSPIFSGERLNTVAGMIAMGILHHGSGHARWGNLVERLGNRNLVQLRLSPDATSVLGLKVFDRVLDQHGHSETFFDESLWRPMKPDNGEDGTEVCPDCGGTGDLTKVPNTP